MPLFGVTVKVCALLELYRTLSQSSCAVYVHVCTVHISVSVSVSVCVLCACACAHMCDCQFYVTMLFCVSASFVLM